MEGKDMKHLLLGSVVVFSLATASTAAAEAPAPAPAAATFSALPGGHIPNAPKGKAPRAIGAGERVAGVFLDRHAGRNDFVNVVPSAAAAKARDQGRGEHQPGDPCFTERQRGFGFGGGEEEEEPQWQPTLQPSLFMSTSFEHGNKPTVTAVHAERVVESGSSVSLEVVDAWVDPLSRGAREIARASVPLQLVSTLLGGDRVFAARDGENVHVVLLSKEHALSRGLFAIADERVLNSGCGHIRATLKAERGQGAAATFISQVELGPADPSEPKPDTSGAKNDPFSALRRLRGEVRIRPVHIQSSLTWSSRDKEPLLTISSGWDAREQTAF